jgi:predicted nucleotide-binding protein
MVGSAHLLWPDSPEQILGLTLLLIQKFAEDSDFMVQVGHMYYYSGNKIMSGVHAVTSQMIIPFARDYKAYVLSRGNTGPKLVIPLSNKIFIVHGHDEGAREAVARFLLQLGFEPIILHEQASRGRTVIEKVEAHGDVSFVVVLLTPDDEGCAKGGTPEPRARQNVLLELGYFIGRLGRENVCALKRGAVEIPSDFAGVVWETMDAGPGWKQALGRELEAAGHTIDWNKVMR